MKLVRRLPRSAVSGLILGLLVVGAFGRLVDLPTQPTDGAPLSAQQPSPQPPATLEPDAAAPAPCRVVGTALVLEADEKSGLAWGTLQNLGSDPATLSVLQLGWTGPATLESVTFAQAGGDTREVFVGTAESPARIKLAPVDREDPMPVVAPGKSARVNLHFKIHEPAGDVALGPSALFFDEGCSLALHQPDGVGCGLTFTSIAPSGNDPRRLVFSLANRGPKATKISALDIRWPVTTNGRLMALYLDGALRYEFKEGLANSPATLKLSRLLGEPVALEPNEPVAIWLEFEDPVATEPYVITAATVDGCLASGTTWLDAPSCGVITNGFATRGTRAQLRLTNALPVTQTMHAVDVFWPTGANGPLVGVNWDGTPVWTGRAVESPATIDLGENAQIARDKTATIELVFDPSASGGESHTASIASGDYVAVFTLRGGCQLVFTDERTVTPGCSVTAGEMTRREGEPEVVVNVNNSAGEAKLRRLEISWPVRNGALTGVWLGATAMFRGSQDPAAEPFVLDLPPGNEATLDRNTSAPLRLRFAERASRLGYGMTMSFVDTEGVACAELLVSPPPGELDCRLAVTSVERESERDVEVFVTNAGRDEVELRFVNVEWPTNNDRNRLVSVHMIDRDSEFLLWTGEARQSPARVPFSAARAAVVDPGEQARIRLHYDQLIGVTDPSLEFQLTVGTAEGCQATHPDPSQQIRPERRTFSGIVLDLPAGSMWGTWTIARQQGPSRDMLPVEVTDATRLEPSSVRAQVGDLVHVEAIDYQGVLHAEKVVFLSPEKMVQLIGTVVELGQPDVSGPHASWIRLTGVSQAIRITADTHIDGRIEVGARVKVEGTSDAQGKITAVRITRQTTPVDELVTVRGTVQRARRSGSEPTVQYWTVGKYRVRVDLSNPESRWPDPPYDRLPQKGARFEVQGRLTGSEIDAQRVTPLVRPRTQQLSGVLAALPAAGMLGTWKVRLDEGDEVEFLVESTAVVDARSAPVAAGVRLEVVAQDMGGGRLSALSVRTDWPD